MSKLELKHLAPYLPYSVKVMSQQGIVFLMDTYSSMGGNCERRTIDVVITNCFKPILYPLSDLVKPCLPDERTPAEEMEDDLMMSWCVVYDEAYEVITENEATLRAKVKMLPYEMVEWLFEHHFDVYGLIEQELAVDINALQT